MLNRTRIGDKNSKPWEKMFPLAHPRNGGRRHSEGKEVRVAPKFWFGKALANLATWLESFPLRQKLRQFDATPGAFLVDASKARAIPSVANCFRGPILRALLASAEAT